MRRVAFVVVPFLFAVSRMRTRPLSVASVTVAVAAAAALVGWSSIAAAVSHDENVSLRLTEVAPGERSIQIAYHLPAGETDTSAAAVARFFRRFDDVTEPVRRVRIWDSIGPGTSLFLPGRPADDVIVTKGRLPSGCRKRTLPASRARRGSRLRTTAVCETLALGATVPLGERVDLGSGTSARVVGHGSLKAETFPPQSEALLSGGRGYRALLVQSLEKSLQPLAAKSGSSIVATAGLAPAAISGWEIAAFSERLRRALARLERTDHSIETAAPLPLLEALQGRGQVARERLLLVAGQAAALLVALAAFAASARRRETRALEEQLDALGATRAQARIMRAVEASVPAVAGALSALVILRIAAELVAERKERPAGFVAAALPLETILSIVALTGAAALLLFLPVARRRQSRLRVGALELAAVTALAVIVWQASATGALDADRIASGKRASPVLLLLPALTFFVVGVLLLRVLPVALRLGERLARRGPFAARLAFVSAARAHGEAAAATTFLAVALGAAVFSLNYRTTLEAQTRDEALFAAGANWRILEQETATEANLTQTKPAGGTSALRSSTPDRSDVTPLTRFARVSSEPATPVLRLEGTLAEPVASDEEVPLEILALPAARLPDVLGWRDSFSNLKRAEIARRLRPRPVRLAGPRIAADADALRVWARAGGRYSRSAILHFLLPGQHFERVVLGQVPRAWRRLGLRLPGPLRGAELVGVELTPTASIFAGGQVRGFAEFGAFEQRRGGRWSALGAFDWTAAPSRGGSVVKTPFTGAPVASGLHFSFAGFSPALIRPGLALPEALPALASGPVAAAAADGIVTVDLLGAEIPLRVISRAGLFPTVLAEPSRFVVLDYDSLFAALNADEPGEAIPTEAWFFDPQPPGFLERLREPPFRLTAAVGAKPLEARLLSDPLADGTRDVLGLAGLVAAALGLLGLVLTTRATLGSERPVLAEYEALGIPPRQLARMTQVRLLALSSFGIAAGVVGALAAVRLVGAFVAVTGTGARPLPPIAIVVAWSGGAAVIGTVIAAALAMSSLLARQSLRETTARRLRA